MNIPFLVRYPEVLKPRVDDMMMSTPDIMPTVLGLCGLEDRIPQEVQGRNLAPLFFNGNVRMVRPDAALYIQNLNGDKDKDGMVRSYFPSARGIKTKDYTLAIFIDKKTGKIKNTMLYHDAVDPYQLKNLPLEENREVVASLCKRMGAMLKEIDDPWYRDRILSDMIPY